MLSVPRHPADPVRWNIAIALGFVLLGAIRLTIPSEPFFDEVHYLPAARGLFALEVATNLEHPPLGKQLIALGMMLFGDGPLGWRIMPLAFGTLALVSAMRAMWFASQSRAVSVLTGVFLVTGFPLLVHSRIAMLDIFMVGFAFLALWMCVAAVRENETARWRLGIAGAALGAAMATKWNAVPLALVPGLAFLAARAWRAGWHFVDTRRGWPIGGMPLWEAAIWLGLVPLAVYALAFWPFMLFDRVPGEPTGLIDLHRQMLALQQSPVEAHTYQSNWPQWIGNWRAIWYLYEMSDGAQRGVLLIGNPLSSLAMLPALAWCGWAALKQGRRDAGGVLVLYLVTLALWVVAPKPVQFYYHYFLPHCFGMAALALAVDHLWRGRAERVLPIAIVAGMAAMFAWFYPILTAAPLDSEGAFTRWAWIDSWR